MPNSEQLPGVAATAAHASGLSSDAAASPLDNPLWFALSGSQRRFSFGDDHVRRYELDVAPFAAFAGPISDCAQSLRQVIPSQVKTAFVTREPLTLPAEFEIENRAILEQWIAPKPEGLLVTTQPELLGPADVSQMMDLVTIAKPGPFLPRTHELGNYYGFRSEGRLVAMAGERMQIPGFTEVSAVATHPEFRGKGYSKSLLATLFRSIIDRGQAPFLQVLADNSAAISLYRHFGMSKRCELRMVVASKRP